MEFNYMDNIYFKVINMNESFAEMCVFDRMNALCAERGPAPSSIGGPGLRAGEHGGLPQLNLIVPHSLREHPALGKGKSGPVDKPRLKVTMFVRTTVIVLFC